MFVYSLIAALLLASAHLFGYRLAFLRAIPRSAWLSGAGGVSVAYVFVHLLPELEVRQSALEEWEALAFIEHHVYVAALVGLAAFYGLERLVRVDEARISSDEATGFFWVHLGAFALYNGLIGYLLVDRDPHGVQELILFAVALALHFIVNDHGLREIHQQGYHDLGRWILTGMVLAGWGLGHVTQLDERWVAVLFALLAGGIILNVLKEELPEERRSRFWAFAVGAGAYTVLLLRV